MNVRSNRLLLGYRDPLSTMVDNGATAHMSASPVSAAIVLKHFAKPFDNSVCYFCNTVKYWRTVWGSNEAIPPGPGV